MEGTKQDTIGEKHDLKGKSNELVFIADGLPPILKKIVVKIVNGEYVDLAELLPRKPLWKIMPTLKLLREWSF